MKIRSTSIAVTLALVCGLTSACQMRPCEEGINAPQQAIPAEGQPPDRRSSQAAPDDEDRLRVLSEEKSELDRQMLARRVHSPEAPSEAELAAFELEVLRERSGQNEPLLRMDFELLQAGRCAIDADGWPVVNWR